MNEDGRRQQVQQGIGSAAIGNLTAGQEKRQRPAETIGQGVDLGGPSTAGSPYRLAQLPPFPPAAQRCALTAVESIKTCAGGPPAEAKA